jgi:hypothetical protein
VACKHKVSSFIFPVINPLGQKEKEIMREKGSVVLVLLRCVTLVPETLKKTQCNFLETFLKQQTRNKDRS